MNINALESRQPGRRRGPWRGRDAREATADSHNGRWLARDDGTMIETGGFAQLTVAGREAMEAWPRLTVHIADGGRPGRRGLWTRAEVRTTDDEDNLTKAEGAPL